MLHMAEQGLQTQKVGEPYCPWKLQNKSQGFSVQCISVTQSCVMLCNPTDCSTPGFPVHHQLLELTHVHSCSLSRWCHPTSYLLSSLLLLPSIFPSIRVFWNESALHIRWAKYWSFSFSISASSEHSGLLSFRVDLFEVLARQGILKSSPTPQFKSIKSSVHSFLYGSSLTSIHDYWKNHRFNNMDFH